MASLTKDGPKKWRIEYVNGQGKRRPIRFSGITPKDAKTLLNLVERLISAKAFGSGIDPHDVKILASLPDKIHQRLAKHGLVESRTPKPEPAAVHVFTLKEFLQDHIDHGRTSKGQRAAESTIMKWVGTKRFLVDLLGADKDIAAITPEDAHQFRVWLDHRRIKKTPDIPGGQPMAENAKRKHMANCKMFFGAAMRRGLVSSNPFEFQVSGTTANRSRDYFLKLSDTRKIIEAAPDAQWRLLTALWRLGGLRKMEVFNLTWGDILWTQGKFRVRSTKTEHIEGCEMRYVPIRDLLPYFEDAMQAVLSPGARSLPATKSVVTRFSGSNTNLDKPFKMIIEAAGLVPWPKLFQNMRASCETQWLKDGERADLVANWIGHSVKVQRLNYVQETEEDIESFNRRTDFLTVVKATQKATQNPPEVIRKEQKSKTKATHCSK